MYFPFLFCMIFYRFFTKNMFFSRQIHFVIQIDYSPLYDTLYRCIVESDFTSLITVFIIKFDLLSIPHPTTNSAITLIHASIKAATLQKKILAHNQSSRIC